MKLKLLPTLAAVIVVLGICLVIHRARHSRGAQVQPEKPVAIGSAVLPPPISPPALQAASPSVRAIVDAQQDYQSRRAGIATLSTNLPLADAQVIESFLIYRNAADNEQRGQVLKNELLNALCELDPPPAWLADALIQTYSDKNQNVVVRDYAVQHMVELYQQLKYDPQGRQALQRTLLGALTETEDSIGGTALLSLEHLSEIYPELDRPEIVNAAVEMAKNISASELVRITSFQVCAEMGAQDALPVVLQEAQSSPSMPLRISAVAALGKLAGTDQVPFLNGLANGTEDRLKPAATHALDEIAARQRKLASQK
jgi:hypothetical protein